MAAYARIYGFQIVNAKSIKGHEEDYTRLETDCYITNSEYDMLTEILEKEFWLYEKSLSAML